MSNFLPLVEELDPRLRADETFLRLCGRPHCVFLDSALRDPLLGRYSFVAADPFDYLEAWPEGPDGLAELARRMARWTATTVVGLPSFQGGAAGLLGYGLGRQLESLPSPATDEFQVPALAVGFYDVVVAFDHKEDRAWIVSQGLPASDAIRRRRRAEQRLRQFRGWLLQRPMPKRESPHGSGAKQIAPQDLAPQYTMTRLDGLVSNFSQRGYLEAVRRAIEYVFDGDIFQVNLSQRLLYPARDDSVSLYLRLRDRNPAPFAGYFDLGGFQVVSASPERFLRVLDAAVETRPIKGTRRRIGTPHDDAVSGEELLRCEKDRAENVMIVDLMRNDLSRACRQESVKVSQLCGLESYPYIQHLVSVVEGVLCEGTGPIDLLKVAFPGGSITGAPKIRAMEIIAELEPTARGAYCGSLGYLGFDGSLDSSILIRTITAGGGWWQAPVGGAVIAQSLAEKEYEETWHKAEGMLRALVP